MATTRYVKTPNDLKKVYNNIYKAIENPINKSTNLLKQLSALVDRDTQLTFKQQGSYLDRDRWKDFGRGRGVSVYKSKNGQWQRREGTDGSLTRKYSNSSKLLQASGQFRQSFRLKSMTREGFKYGTQMSMAQKIMSDPVRQVLHYTKRDQDRYSTLVSKWWSKETKV